eukprot:scaffold1446_cov173-Pinguiococcus_pyrenoidosus.AAC.1
MPLPPRSRLVSCVTWGSPCVARAVAPSDPMSFLLLRVSAPRLRVISCGRHGNPRSTNALPPMRPIPQLKRSSVVPPSPYALRTLDHHPGSPPYSAGQVGALRWLMVLLCGARVATKMAHSAGNARDGVPKKDFHSQVSTFISY